MLVPDRSWTFVAYRLLELRDYKVSFHGVTPSYLTADLNLMMHARIQTLPFTLIG